MRFTDIPLELISEVEAIIEATEWVRLYGEKL